MKIILEKYENGIVITLEGADKSALFVESIEDKIKFTGDVRRAMLFDAQDDAMEVAQPIINYYVKSNSEIQKVVFIVDNTDDKISDDKISKEE